jgi:hypothetical protein
LTNYSPGLNVKLAWEGEKMNVLIRSEFLLLVLAAGLFTLAALHFTGHFDAWAEAQAFFQ